MLMGGAGLLAYTKLKTEQPVVADVSSLSVTTNGVTYTLKGVEYGTGGSAKTFYQITSAEELSLLSYMVSVAKNTTWAGANFELTNDIDLQNAAWTPIGTYDNPFTGIFNGKGYTINGLNVTESSTQDVYFSAVDFGTNDESKPAPITPTNNDYYHVASDSYSIKHAGEYVGNYYVYDDVHGYQLIDENDVVGTANEIYVYDSTYYGLFGYVKGTSVKNAEITDVVIGRNAYVAIDNYYAEEELETTEPEDWCLSGYDARCSGTLVARAEYTKFYNVYDSSAERNAYYSEDTGYYAAAGAYSTAGDGIHYYYDNGDFVLIPSNNSTNYASSYVKIYKLNTGAVTYYYSAGTVTLYTTITVVDSVGTLSDSVYKDGLVSVSSKKGEVTIGDKKFNYEIDSTTKEITFVLDERYIVGNNEDHSIVVDGTTYYYAKVGHEFKGLYTNSACTSGEILYDWYHGMSERTGWGEITVAGILHEYVWDENDDYQLRIVSNKENFTVGFADSHCEFYKGQYYRLNSLQFIGIGTVEEAAYDGTINISGTTYYYKFNQETGELFFYTSASTSFPRFTGRGNAGGVGTISISSTDYIFAYKSVTKDLELSGLSSYSTQTPYTIKTIGGSLQLEDLTKGRIIAFNTAMENVNNAGLFYVKGAPTTLASYNLLYVDGTGISEIDYSSTFKGLQTVLPTAFENATAGNYYVMNTTAGNRFKNWTVPDVATGKSTIVYSDAVTGIHSYILSADTTVDGGKTYYTFANGVFTQVASPTGNPSTSSYYEKISQNDTMTNIYANNYEVNAVWTTKNYTVYVDIAGTKTNSTVGYGTKWDTYAAGRTRTGYDLTGIYYYTLGYGTNNSTSGDKVYAYSLQYEYDNYGNLSTFSYIKTLDVALDANKTYYTFNGTDFAEVETPTVGNIATYYERVTNASYGSMLGANTLGYDYFVAFAENATTPEAVYVYTEWAKRPVFGKLQFTNTTDAYVKTTDTAIDASKTYYTKSGTTYTVVASPTVANIGTYYEASRLFLDGKVTNINVNARKGLSPDFIDPTKYFFQTSLTDDFTQVQFTIASGFEINYIYPTAGSLSLTSVDYYYYDGNTYYHRYYDTNDTELKTVAFVAGGTYADTASIASPEAGAIYVVGGRYYIYSSTFTEVPMLTISGNNYTYKSYTAYDAGFTIFFDITRKAYEATLNITAATGFTDSVADKVTYELIQDGETIDSGDVTTTSQTLHFKYSSSYTLIVTPKSDAYLVESTNDPLVSNITTFGVTFVNGIATFTGTVDTISSNPTFTVRLTYDKFKVFTEYTYASGSSYISGSVLPLLEVASLKDADVTLYGTQTFSSSGYEFYNYAGKAHVAITSNAYYSVSTTSYEIYSVAATNVSGTATVNSVGTTFATVTFTLDASPATYYILLTDANFNSSTGAMNGATLYTKGAETVLSGTTIEGIGRNKVILVKNVLAVEKYDATANTKRAYSAGTFTDLVNIYGTQNLDGNLLEISRDSAANFSTSEVGTIAFGDKIVFRTTITDAQIYTCTAIYMGYKGGIYKIADIPSTMVTGTTGVGPNFVGATQTRYGTAQFENIGGTIYLTVLLDKAEPDDVDFYATFEPNTASIAINTNKTYILNYDGGLGAYTANITAVTMGSNNTFGGSGIAYGDNTAKIIDYVIPNNPDFYLKGWAIFDTNLGYVVLTKEYNTTYTVSGQDTAATYPSYFSANISILREAFRGATKYQIIPIVVQRSVTITLNAGEGTGSSQNVTYYAGGAGLNLSSYGSGFTKTGYTAIGWTSTTPAITMTDSISTVLSGSALSGASYYNSAFTLSRTYTANTYKIFFETQAGDVISSTITKSDGGVPVDSRSITQYEVAGADYGKYYMQIAYGTWFALPNLGRAGYSFNGWTDYTSIPRDLYTVGTHTALYQTADDLHLTPSFTARTYAVTIDSNGGKFANSDEVIDSTVTYGAALLSDVSANPTRDGYTFDGWYLTVVGESTYEAITTSTTMNKTIGSFDTITGLTSTSETYNDIIVYAAWARVAESMDVDNFISTATYDYTGSNLKVNNVLDVWFGDIYDTMVNGEISFDAYDYCLREIAYSSTENGTYSSTLPTSVSIGKYGDLFARDVVASGYYKYTFSFVNESELVNQTMIDEETFTIEKTFHLTINPLTVATASTYASHTWTATYDGTNHPSIVDNDGQDNVTLSTLFGNNSTGASLLNINKLYVTGYAIGNKAGSVFTAGSNAGTYNTVRFYVEFINGFTYTSGNFENIQEDGGLYFFDQAHTVTISPLAVELEPVVPKVFYTGLQQIITFTNTIQVNGSPVTISAIGTMSAGNIGGSGASTNVAGSTFTKSGDTISGDILANFSVSLGGSVQVEGQDVSYNTFATHVITKASSGASTYTISANGDYIVVSSLSTSSTTYNLSNLASGVSAVVDNGETYIFDNGNLVFQFNNNSTTFNVYYESNYSGAPELSSITFETGHDTTTYNLGTYYYFGTYVSSGTEQDAALGTLAANGLISMGAVAISERDATYYIGYTDLVPVTFTEVAGTGTANTETKYLKLGSTLDYAPSASGYTFSGWVVTTGADFISVANSSEVTASIPASPSWAGNTSGLACRATWGAEAPNVTATVVGHTESATGSDSVINFYSIFSGVTGTTETEKLQSILSNFVSGKSVTDYTFKWYTGSGAMRTEIAGAENSYLTILSTTAASGTYTLRIGYDGQYTYVPFTITVNTVELELNEATRNFTYAYGVNQATNVTIGVPDSVHGTSFTLSNSLSSSNPVYFTIEKVKDADGNNITPVSVNQIVDAGTYTVTLCYDSTIYTVQSTQSFNVVVAKQTYEFTKTYVKTKLGFTDEAFEKTIGESNAVLTQSSSVLFDNTQDQGKEIPFDITFSVTGTANQLGTYAISGVSSANDNYAFTLATGENALYLQVNANTQDTLYFSLGSIAYKDESGNPDTGYTYNGVALTTATLAYDSGNSIWKLSLIDSSSRVRAIWDVTVYLYIDQNTQTIMTGSDIDPADYPFTVVSTVKNAGTYGQAIFSISPVLTPGHAAYGNVSTAQTGDSFVIGQKAVTITAMSKVFDNDYTFDSTTDTMTLSGLVGSENFSATGTYADYKAGTGISVTDISFAGISGAVVANYSFPTTYNAGAITASADTVTITATDNSKEYGIVKNTVSLNLNFVGNSLGALNAELFNVTSLTIVDPQYSTGGWLKAGTYDVNVVLSSDSLSDANYTVGSPLVLQLTITTKTLELSYSTITKAFDNSVNVVQTITVTGVCAGDVAVTATATYDNASVGTGKAISFSLSGTDAANYTHNATAVTGTITERTSTILSLITEPSAFVDGNHALVEGGTKDGNNYTYDIGTYTSTTTGLEVMAAIPDATKSGYTFNGWSADGYASVGSDNVITIINTALANGTNPVLTAKWSKNSYTITKTQGADTTLTVAAGADYYNSVTFSASTVTGFTVVVGATYFNGESNISVPITNNGDGTYTFTMPAGNVTITTSTEADVYNISYTTNGGTFVSLNPTTHTYGTSTVIPNLTKTGFTFNGWIINGAGEPQKDLTLGATAYTADIALEASWTADVYKIYFDPSFTNPATSENADFSNAIKATLTLDGTTGYYYKEVNFADVLDLPSPSLGGYSFSGWSLKTAANAFVGGEVVSRSASTGVAQGSTFDFIEDVVLNATYVTGSYTVTLSFNPTTANLSVAVQVGGNAVVLSPLSGNAGYSFSAVGGQNYVFTVTPNAGYSINAWSCEGQTGLTTNATISFTDNRTIVLSATANVNNITLYASVADYDLLSFAATVNGSAAAIVEHVLQAPTDSDVVVTVTAASGYTLNDTTQSGCTVVRNGSQFTISGFTSNASVTFSLQANEFNATITKDELEGITSLSSAVQFTQEATGWSRIVATGTTLIFTPNIASGYAFDGVKYGLDTIGLGETNYDPYNVPSVIIEVSAVGQVTISGYTDAFTIELLTSVNTYDLTITAYALNTDDENVPSVEINIQYSDPLFAGTVVYGEDITVTATTEATGYKFIGWYTQAEIENGVVTYSNKLDTLGNSLTITMPNNDITRYAIFQITNVDLTFTVKTNDTTENTNGGKVYDVNTVEVVSTLSPLYNETVTFYARAASGYKFVGWFIGEDNVTSLTGYSVENLSYSGLDVSEASIEFTITEELHIYAKFAAKAIDIEYETALLVYNIVTYPTGAPYYTVQWGTYVGTTFTVDPTFGSESPIKTITGGTVYIKVVPDAGYFVDNIYSIGSATFTAELVSYTEATSTYIYSISSLNADAGTYAASIRFYSSETLVTITFASGDSAVEAGQFSVTAANGISIEANGTSNVRVIAITGTELSFVAYVRLGYEFELNALENVDYNLSGTASGDVEVVTQGKMNADKTLGFGYYTPVTISGYSGGYINLALKVKASKYKLNLYASNSVEPFISGIEVNGGSLITKISQGQKTQIRDIDNVEGYTLQGFYPYADGSGYMYIDGLGNGVRVFNDNGYYWNGSAYVISPYYTELSNDLDGYAGIFKLYAVYVMNKTAITMNAIPPSLKDEDPTVTAKAVIAELNSANSWTIGTEPFYAEVIYGAKVSAIAPFFTNYEFAYWKVERLGLDGQTSVVYITTPRIAELEHNNYRELYLTAVYYVRERVAATSGGSVTISGYQYAISNNGLTMAQVEKETTIENYFSTVDNITFTAVPHYGYIFLGWFDEEENLVSTEEELVLDPYEDDSSSPNKLRPLALEARFEGETLNITISAPVSEIGSIVRVYRNEDTISTWPAFTAQVGDRIEIHINIPNIRYQATWNNSHVNTEYSTGLRIYSYIVDKMDVLPTDEETISLVAEFTSRNFKFKLNYSLIDQVISNETSLAGKIVYNGTELANNYSKNLIYGDSIIISLLVNNNYEINSITVNGEELSSYLSRNRHESLNYARGGTFTIQTSDFDYDFEQEVDISVEYRRIYWLDDVDTTHSLTGNGTENNPYIIASIKDLTFMAYMINVQGSEEYASASYILTNDIDLTGKYWSPIGTEENPFNGTFNFKVFEISNISVDINYEGTTRFEGLFGRTSANAQIIKTENNIGLILGIAGGALAAIGIIIGIFLGIRAKKKRDLDRLANG